MNKQGFYVGGCHCCYFRWGGGNGVGIFKKDLEAMKWNPGAKSPMGCGFWLMPL